MISKEMLRQIAPEIENALREVGKKNGVRFSVGSCRYDSLKATFKLELNTTDTKAIQEQEKKDFSLYCKLEGLEPEDFGRVFMHKGEQFHINGIAPNRPKFSVMARRVSDGQQFFFPAKNVCFKLGKPSASIS